MSENQSTDPSFKEFTSNKNNFRCLVDERHVSQLFPSVSYEGKYMRSGGGGVGVGVLWRHVPVPRLKLGFLDFGEKHISGFTGIFFWGSSLTINIIKSKHTTPAFIRKADGKRGVRIRKKGCKCLPWNHLASRGTEPGNHGSTPGMGNRFLSFPNCPDRFWVPHILIFMGHCRLLFCGNKETGALKWLSTSTAKVTSKRSHAMTPHTPSWGVQIYCLPLQSSLRAETRRKACQQCQTNPPFHGVNVTNWRGRYEVHAAATEDTKKYHWYIDYTRQNSPWKMYQSFRQELQCLD